MKKYIKFSLLILFVIVVALCTINLLSYDTAITLAHQKKYKQVKTLTNINLKISNDKSKWYSLKAYIDFQEKNYNEAIKNYDKAYLLSNDDFGVMNFDNKIYIKYYLKKYNEAIKDFDTEIKNCKNENIKDSFLWDKAQFLYNIGQYEAALKIYSILILKSNRDYTYLMKNRLYYERAEVLDKLNLKSAAQKDRKTADDLDLDPTYKNPIPKPTLLLDDLQF